MRTKKKIILILLTILCCLFTALGACSQTESALTIKLIEYSEREELFFNQEYDASSLIDTEEGVEYTIDELFFINDKFERENIPFDGLRFTQNQPYDVTMVLGAKKGNQTDSAFVELKLQYQVDPILAGLKSTWSDSGVSKLYNGRAEFLTNDAQVSLKTRVMTTEVMNAPGNGIVIGSIARENVMSYFSITDWDNPVVEFDVYNAHDKNLQIGMLLYRKLEGVNDAKIVMLDELPAGEWTHVTWSLRTIGWAGDFLTGGGYIDLKVRQVETNESGKYDYAFYMCNIDVANYDAQKHVGLETRTPEEIEQEKIDAITGDPIDVVMAASGTVHQNTVAELNTDKAFVKEGDTSMKYTFTQSDTVIGATKLRSTIFDNNKRLFDKFNVTDWDNAYLGFWLYNASEGEKNTFSIQAAFANTQDGSKWQGSTDFNFGGYYANKGSGQGEWRYLEWSLAEFKYVDKNKEEVFIFKEDVTNCRISLAIEGGEDRVNVFYIDGLSVYSKKSIDAFDAALIAENGGTTASSFTQTNYNDDEANVKDGDSSIQCTYGGDVYGAAFAVENGGILLMIPDNQQQGIYDDFSAYDADNDTYKSATNEKTYAGFWVKNTTGKQLEVCLNIRLYYAAGTDYSEYTYGAKALNYVGNGNNTQSLTIAANDTAWHYYELELPNVPDTFYTAHKVRMGVAAKIENATAGDAFYIDAFDIYHGSRKP